MRSNPLEPRFLLDMESGAIKTHPLMNGHDLFEIMRPLNFHESVSLAVSNDHLLLTTYLPHGKRQGRILGEALFQVDRSNDWS